VDINCILILITFEKHLLSDFVFPFVKVGCVLELFSCLSFTYSRTVPIHPVAHQELICITSICQMGFGSSPSTRGTRHIAAPHSLFSRFIPIHTGNSLLLKFRGCSQSGRQNVCLDVLPGVFLCLCFRLFLLVFECLNFCV